MYKKSLLLVALVFNVTTQCDNQEHQDLLKKIETLKSEKAELEKKLQEQESKNFSVLYAFIAQITVGLIQQRIQTKIMNYTRPSFTSNNSDTNSDTNSVTNSSNLSTPWAAQFHNPTESISSSISSEKNLNAWKNLAAKTN